MAFLIARGVEERICDSGYFCIARLHSVMSLFASLGHGDIWSLSGISFVSPINDLLDKGSFTLEELLKEDELIQEVKAKNVRLLDFLYQEESIEKLISYVIHPAHDDDDDMRRYRYPYMSCELICCEMPEILHILVEERDGAFLDCLFDFLNQEGALDCFLAGYFEKILEMLFRKMTTPMMMYFNRKGMPLFRLFLEHISNYSIMQIIQRLMLPHLPFSSPENDVLTFPEDLKDVEQCNWSFTPEACELLLQSMLRPRLADEPLHVSDMLITVLQLSPPETLLIKFLCKPSSVRALLIAATEDIPTGNNNNKDGPEEEEESDDLDEDSQHQKLQLKQNVRLAAASVLESLISRLFESGFPLQPSQLENTNNTSLEAQQQILLAQQESEAVAQVHAQIRDICDELAPLLYRVTDVLTRILETAALPLPPLSPEDNTSKLASNRHQPHHRNRLVHFQSKIRTPRLGHHGLQTIKLVESLARVGSYKVDEAFRHTGLLHACLQLFLVFEGNSVLHLSVQRIFVTILEAPSVRCDLQRHLLYDCGLLQTIMQRVGRGLLPDEEYAQDESNGTPAPVYRCLVSEQDGFVFNARHSSQAGHLVLIAHAAYLLLAGKDVDELSDDSADEEDAKKSSAEGAAGLEQNGGDAKETVEDILSKGLNDVSLEATADKQTQVSNADGGSDVLVLMQPGSDDERQQRASTLRAAIADPSLLSSWDRFIDGRFKRVLEHQVVSSSSASNSVNSSLNNGHSMVPTVTLTMPEHYPGVHDAIEDMLDDEIHDEDDDDDHRQHHRLQHHWYDDHDLPQSLRMSEHTPWSERRPVEFHEHETIEDHVVLEDEDPFGPASTSDDAFADFADFDAFGNTANQSSLSDEHVVGEPVFSLSPPPPFDAFFDDHQSHQHDDSFASFNTSYEENAGATGVSDASIEAQHDVSDHQNTSGLVDVSFEEEDPFGDHRESTPQSADDPFFA